MACNCKNAQRIKEANEGKIKLGLFERGFYFFKKLMLFAFAICLAIIVTPIVIFSAIYNIVFRGTNTVTVPNKFLNMLKSNP